jgi:hypothetical protein
MCKELEKMLFEYFYGGAREKECEFNEINTKFN